jgi:Lon protease-like protein
MIATVLVMILLPLFPLPTVVLFPDVMLPLHIFEPRYRALLADALDSDRRLGMVLLRPGWEADYEGRPPIFEIGCSAVIVHAEGLDDGRSNIVLRGLERFRIASEDHERPYRRATVVPLPDPPLSDAETAALAGLRAKLENLLGVLPESRATALSPHVSLASMPDADFVHTLAQYLDLEPIEKQALLEREGLCVRAEALVQLLEMRRVLAGMPAPPALSH